MPDKPPPRRYRLTRGQQKDTRHADVVHSNIKKPLQRIILDRPHQDDWTLEPAPGVAVLAGALVFSFAPRNEAHAASVVANTSCKTQPTTYNSDLVSRLHEEFPHMRTIAVDAVGSVIFGGDAGPHKLPGIGASRVPELLRREEIDEIIYVNDQEASQGCRDLLFKEGIFAGGSSGSIVAALKKLLPTFLPHSCVVTLFPDRGERYLEMVYNDEWLNKFSPTQVLLVPPV